MASLLLHGKRGVITPRQSVDPLHCGADLRTLDFVLLDRLLRGLFLFVSRTGKKVHRNRLLVEFHDRTLVSAQFGEGIRR